MTRSQDLRREAERYRQLAARETSAVLRDQLLGYARQSEALADILDEHHDVGSPQAEPQRQAVQQQQQKKTDEPS